VQNETVQATTTKTVQQWDYNTVPLLVACYGVFLVLNLVAVCMAGWAILDNGGLGISNDVILRSLMVTRYSGFAPLVEQISRGEGYQQKEVEKTVVEFGRKLDRGGLEILGFLPI